SCGNRVADADFVCGSCGVSLVPGSSTSAGLVGNASAATPPESGSRQSARIGAALTSLALGLFLFVFWIPVWYIADGFPNHIRPIMQSFLGVAAMAAICAIILGRRVKAANLPGQGRSAARVLAAIGRTFGYLSLAAIVLFFAAAYYVPRFVQSSRREANQASA